MLQVSDAVLYHRGKEGSHFRSTYGEGGSDLEPSGGERGRHCRSMQDPIGGVFFVFSEKERAAGFCEAGKGIWYQLMRRGWL